jgi:5,5'-dehydrodivanillate O-demethylase
MDPRDNDRLTRVGPSTPMGELLRRYWHPIATTGQLAKESVLPIRLLGEDLVLFQIKEGSFGLIDQHCSHRGVSLACGIPESGGLRCSYHGWLFDPNGECIERPFEDRHQCGSSRNSCPSAKVKAYSVAVLGGIVFAYLGPDPAPVCLDWGLLSRADIHREVKISVTPCNWFQIMENALDPIHHEWLHGHFASYVIQRQNNMLVRSEQGLAQWQHQQIDFKKFRYGINKCRLIAGETPDSLQWQIGHPVLFPNIVWFQKKVFWRVPVDDTHTLTFCVSHRPLESDEDFCPTPELTIEPSQGYFSEPGIVRWQNAGTIGAQDEIIWIAQGQIADRSRECLARSDRGITMLRNLFFEQLERVAMDQDPMNIFRSVEEADFSLIQCAPTLQESVPVSLTS